MANSNTSICNQALGVIGANSIEDLDTDTSVQAIQCRLHFEADRDALIRSHYWRFASGRAELVQDTTDPDFEYDSQFILPSDFMRFKSLFVDNLSPSLTTRITIAIEGQRLLTNETAINMRYIKEVTDPTEFDPLFVKLLVYTLADDLIGPLAGGDKGIQKKIDGKMNKLMPQVRALDRQETNNIGRDAHIPWTEVRVSGGASWRQDRV